MTSKNKEMKYLSFYKTVAETIILYFTLENMYFDSLIKKINFGLLIGNLPK